MFAQIRRYFNGINFFLFSPFEDSFILQIIQFVFWEILWYTLPTHIYWILGTCRILYSMKSTGLLSFIIRSFLIISSKVSNLVFLRVIRLISKLICLVKIDLNKFLGKHIFYLARKMHDIELLEMLAKNGFKFENSYITLQQLEKILLYRRIDILNFLVNHNILQKLVINDNTQLNNILVLAINNCCLETIKILVQKGANVNHIKQGRSMLGIAIQKNNSKIIEFLIQKGANVNHIEQGRSMLGIAIRKNNSKIVEFLIQKGANVNHIEQGRSMLELAFSSSNTKIIKLLLLNGITLENFVAIFSRPNTAYILKMNVFLQMCFFIQKGNIQKVNKYLKDYKQNISKKMITNSRNPVNKILIDAFKSYKVNDSEDLKFLIAILKKELIFEKNKLNLALSIMPDNELKNIMSKNINIEDPIFQKYLSNLKLKIINEIEDFDFENTNNNETNNDNVLKFNMLKNIISKNIMLKNITKTYNDIQKLYSKVLVDDIILLKRYKTNLIMNKA